MRAVPHGQPVTIADAAANFVRAIRHCDDVVAVHKRTRSQQPSGGTPASRRGRRYEELSLNRAVVVMGVAAWQAVLQDLVRACVDLATTTTSGSSAAMTSLLKGQVLRAVDSFSTPNGEKTRELIKLTGFDPFPRWTWRHPTGTGGSWVTVTPGDANAMLNKWLKIRHAVAHGDAELPLLDVLEQVRLNRVPASGGPNILLDDAKRCVALLRKLTTLTGYWFAKEMNEPVPAVWEQDKWRTLGIM